MPIALSDLCGSVFLYWEDERPEPVSTLTPGSSLKADDLSEWIELWVDAVTGTPIRSTHPDRTTVLLTAHVFVRATTDLNRGRTLARMLSDVFRHARIPIRDHSATGTELLGTLRFDEPTVRDLTRTPTGDLDPTRQHLLLTLRGVADET